MKTTDWKYAFSTLPRWDNRERIPYVYDEYYELPQSNSLCCLYSICEVSMMNNLGFLAILKNKEAPELVVNISEFPFCTNFSASADGDLIFLQPSLYDRDRNQVRRPVLILDLPKNRFSFIRAANYSPCYEVIQKKETVFEIVADEHRKNNPQPAAYYRRKIRTRWLRWYPMDHLYALPKMIL